MRAGLGLIPGLGRSPGEGTGYPLQYSGLENSMDRGAWQVTVHGVPKRWTWLSDFHYLWSAILCSWLLGLSSVPRLMRTSSLRRGHWHPTPVLLPGGSRGQRSLVGCRPWGCRELDMTEWLHFHALEKEMATRSSVLAWRIPGTGEPGGLPSMGSHRVRHDWSDLAAAAAAALRLAMGVQRFKKYKICSQVAFSFTEENIHLFSSFIRKC